MHLNPRNYTNKFMAKIKWRCSTPLIKIYEINCKIEIQSRSDNDHVVYVKFKLKEDSEV